MSPLQPLRPRLVNLGLAGLLLTVQGCSSLATGGSWLSAAGRTPAQELPEVASCQVELRPDVGRGKQVRVPLTQDMRVQEVLVASKATRKFRRMQVDIVRPATEKPGQIVKLSCRFDRKADAITWDTDYAVLPGDRVIVREDNTTVVDAFFDTVIGPILGERG